MSSFDLSGDTLWAALPLPAIMLSAEGDILALNPAAESFFVASARALVGKPLRARLQFDATLDAAIQRTFHSEAPLYVKDVSLSLQGGATRPCNLKLVPYENNTGARLLLITPQDSDGLLPVNSAKTSTRSVIGMAQMLAHEIKNPLAGITGAAQLLSMNVNSQDTELTDLIVEESRRIVKLLEQVEQFGNLSPPNFLPTNLHDVLDRARRSALVGFGAGMEIIEDYDPSLPPANVDPDQLLQVLLNLLKNAAEAAGQNGQIRLRTYYEHGFSRRSDAGASQPLPLQIEVIDNGAGIAPEFLEQIFDPFISGKENGTGLGLALTAKIIAAHNGWVSCCSKPGETVFRLALPRAPETQQQLKKES